MMLAFTPFSRRYSSHSFKLASSLLKKSEDYFDGALKKLRLIECKDGKSVAELKVDKEHTSVLNSLHGGASATLIDSSSALALFSNKQKYMMPSVSIDLHIQFLKAAMLGDEILIETETVKCGTNIAFLKTIIKNKKNGDILVCGNHVKYFVPTNKPVIEF